jgi:hypothetical protein
MSKVQEAAEWMTKKLCPVIGKARSFLQKHADWLRGLPTFY